jgi:hypothetical protein
MDEWHEYFVVSAFLPFQENNERLSVIPAEAGIHMPQ